MISINGGTDTRMARTKVVCFVDDDPEETRCVREFLGDRFVIGAGQSIPAALEDLRNKGVNKPDLFLLDMYFPKGPLPMLFEPFFIDSYCPILSRISLWNLFILLSISIHPDRNFYTPSSSCVSPIVPKFQS